MPWSLWPLSLLGFAAMIWLVARAERPRSAILRGWLAGSAYFGLSLHWITEPFQVDAARDAWMAPFAVVFLAIGLALFWAGAAALAQALRRFMPVAAGFALMLALLEGLRGMIFSGFPWAMPGHIWIPHAPGQLAALAGAGGLTLFTVTLAALPTLARGRGIAAALVLLAASWGYGEWRLQGEQPTERSAVVRLVQPNADQALKWDPVHARTFFRRQLDLTAAPPGPLSAPSLILWPETSVPFWLEDPGSALLAIADAAQGTPVGIGVQRGEGMRVYNSLAIIEAEGRIGQVYDKHHLVPFGEYIPGGAFMADWFGIFTFSPADGFGYSAGPAPQLMPFGGALGTAQPLICYEAVFPWFQRAVERPDWILQITNDAWFGEESGPFQHLALARLRAIENGLPVIRSANTGVSAVIGPRGELISTLGMGQIGVIDSRVPGALAPTFYSQTGPWTPILLWWLVAAALLAWRKSPFKH